MKSPRLEAKRESSEPICANCKFWAARDEAKIVYSAMCEPKQLVTLDLANCSGWEPHEIMTGKILKPDEVIDEG